MKDASPKDYHLTVTLRNNRILARMKEAGVESMSDLARRLGNERWSGEIGDFVAMKVSGRMKSGEWRALALKLADFFRCLPEDLFNDQQQNRVLVRNRVHAEIAYEEIQSLIHAPRSAVTPEIAAQASELREAIARSLSTLTPREERVIRLRFGFETGKEETLEEVGRMFNVNMERIRQIEAKALRKLKHPRRSGKFLDAAGVTVSTYSDGDSVRKIRVPDETILDAL